jgi:hypothetical protein
MTRPYVRLMPTLIDAYRPNAVTPEEAAARISERDARQASDTRTAAQVLLNEPEPSRSALSGVKVPSHSLFVPVRMKLGKSRTTPHHNPAVWKTLQNK